ncbi:MAG: metal-dependent transcriptional regulator [Coriobacteriia bacterium]|nr:metal-dependent transcriptional regulator [Coriobacteriia bacterium]
MSSATLEEYLEMIYKLAERGEVRPSQLAEAMGVSGPTVTATLKRLLAKGLISRPDNGVALTASGESEAISIVRRHRLAERFLVDALGLSWDEVHEEACLLEHALSPKVQSALETFLENPSFCPHGHPIPRSDGTVPKMTGEPLCDFVEGSRVKIVRVEDEDDSLLAYLASLGMYPGTEVGICDVAPFNGPLMIEVGDSKYALGRDVASKIVVSLLKKPAKIGRRS